MNIILPQTIGKETPLVMVADSRFLFPTLKGRNDAIWVGLDPEERDDAFTPWKAEIPKIGHFGGKGDRYLEETEKRIKAVRDQHGLEGKTGIMGVSLGGLFAVYAALRLPLFSWCVSISGSFWYPGWSDFLDTVPSPLAQGYFCSGEDEGRGRKDALKDARTGSEKTAACFHTTLVTDKGGHMSYQKERIAGALSWLEDQFQQ